MSVYLDYAAATPLDNEVFAAMQPYFSELFHNPSALYSKSVEASRALDDARAETASVLGAKASEIIFTAGGTEANNLAIHGVMRAYPGANMVLSAIEHDSVREPAGLYGHKEAGVGPDGVIEFEDIKHAIDEKTVLVSVMYANNEIGTVQPLKKIAAVLQDIKAARRAAGNNLPLYFHTDAAQAGNYLDMHTSRIGIDLMTINGGKLYGPKQTGALFVKSGTVMSPLIQGGGQERNLRSGTENVAGAAGFAKALSISSNMRKEETARLGNLQQIFMNGLKKDFPKAVVNGSIKQRLPNNIHVTFPGIDNERLLIQLDNEGICAAAGSACSAASEEPSHVLKALGLPNGEIRSSVRFSMGRQTTEKEILHTLQTLKRLIA